MIGWLKWLQWLQWKQRPLTKWDWGVLYAILFLTVFRLSEVDYIIAHKPDILGAIIPALQHPFQGSDWQAPYGLIWYGVSELVYLPARLLFPPTQFVSCLDSLTAIASCDLIPSAQAFVALTALIDAGLMWLIRKHRLVTVLYFFSSWYEFNQAPYNLPPMWMSLLGLLNPWAVLLGPLTKFPDLPSQIAFVFYTPILSTQGNYNRFWQLWFYGLILLPSLGILIEKAYNRNRNKSSATEQAVILK